MMYHDQVLVWDPHAFEAFSSICAAAGNDETGALLIGHRCTSDLADGMARILYVVAVIAPGPAATATTVSFAPDRNYQSKVLNAVLRANPGLCLLGEGHRHPGWLPTPSRHDLFVAAEMATDRSLRCEDETFPIVIATHTRGRTTTRCFLVKATKVGPEVREVPVLVGAAFIQSTNQNCANSAE